MELRRIFYESMNFLDILGRESESASERERGERETTGYKPFALHAPRHWAIQGDLIKNRG